MAIKGRWGRCEQVTKRGNNPMRIILASGRLPLGNHQITI
jgi:hypothetical protein